MQHYDPWHAMGKVPRTVSWEISAERTICLFPTPGRGQGVPVVWKGSGSCSVSWTSLRDHLTNFLAEREPRAAAAGAAVDGLPAICEHFSTGQVSVIWMVPSCAIRGRGCGAAFTDPVRTTHPWLSVAWQLCLLTMAWCISVSEMSTERLVGVASSASPPPTLLNLHFWPSSWSEVSHLASPSKLHLQGHPT